MKGFISGRKYSKNLNCFGSAYIIMRILVRVKLPLYLVPDPDPRCKQFNKNFKNKISNKYFTNFIANLEKIKNNKIMMNFSLHPRTGFNL